MKTSGGDLVILVPWCVNFRYDSMIHKVQCKESPLIRTGYVTVGSLSSISRSDGKPLFLT